MIRNYTSCMPHIGQEGFPPAVSAIRHTVLRCSCTVILKPKDSPPCSTAAIGFSFLITQPGLIQKDQFWISWLLLVAANSTFLYGMASTTLRAASDMADCRSAHLCTLPEFIANPMISSYAWF